jgi:sugar-phosphatase
MELKLRERAVLADCDGTLLDSAEAQAEAWTRWAERVGADPAEVLGAHGLRAVDKVRRFAPHLDPQLEALAMAAIEADDAHRARALPGALDLLTCGLQVAIVTSGTARLIRARLAAAGLPAPKVLVTAETVESGKPDPAGYRLAAKLLGRHPSGCDVLEDAPAGVQAGVAAGARVFGLRTTVQAKELTGAHMIVEDVAEYLRVRAAAM